MVSSRAVIFEELGKPLRVEQVDYSDPAPDPIDQPSALLDQLKWLEAAGLRNVDVHWLMAGHAIFSGVKPG